MTSEFKIIDVANGCCIVKEIDTAGLVLYYKNNHQCTQNLKEACDMAFLSRNAASLFIHSFLDPEFVIEGDAPVNRPNDDFESYGDMVSKLVKSGQAIINSLIPEKMNAMHMAIGVCGEAGELIDCIKKWAIYDKALDRDNLIEELGDIEFYLEGMRQQFNLDRQDILNANRKKLADKNKGRFAKGSYSDADAHARADKIVDPDEGKTNDEILAEIAVEVFGEHLTVCTQEGLRIVDSVPSDAIDITSVEDLSKRYKRFILASGETVVMDFNGTHPDDDNQAVS